MPTTAVNVFSPNSSSNNASPTPVITAVRPLKIALLGYRSHPHVGGQGIYLQYLSRALKKRGHEIDVLSGPPYPELDEGVNLIQIPSLDLYAHPNPHRALKLKHLGSFTDIYEWWSKLSGSFEEPYCFARRVTKYFKKNNPAYDVVHDNQCLAYGLLDLQTMGYPLVVTIHHPITQDRKIAVDAATTRGHKWLVKRWYSFIDMQLRVVKKLAHIVTVSQQSKVDIAQDFAINPERIQVMGNGVDTDVFKPSDTITIKPHRLITTASSDQPLKGLSVLLEAFSKAREKIPNLELIVIGKLNPEGETVKQLARLNLSSAVIFKSNLSTQELVEEYAQAHCAVVPSLYEGFGLPAAEALACAKPLICSDGGALPEVVGDAAYLVPAGDSEAMSEAIVQLMTNETLCQSLAEKARLRSLNQLSWDKVAENLEAYYYSLLKQE